MRPAGFDDAQWQKYLDNTSSRKQRGLEPLDPGDWRTLGDRLARNQRRGNVYRDSIHQSMQDHGYRAEDGWVRERASPLPGQEQHRRHDIGNIHTAAGLEIKVGDAGGRRSRRELAHDRRAARAGQLRVWILEDRSKITDKALLEQLSQTEQRFGRNFAVDDAADPASGNAFKQRFPEHERLADAVREGTDVFHYYDREYDRREASGQTYSLEEARRDWSRARQAQKLASIGSAAPVGTGVRPPTHEDLHREGVPAPRRQAVRRTAVRQVGLGQVGSRRDGLGSAGVSPR